MLVSSSHCSTSRKERSPVAVEAGGEGLHHASLWGHTQGIPNGRTGKAPSLTDRRDDEKRRVEKDCLHIDNMPS